MSNIQTDTTLLLTCKLMKLHFISNIEADRTLFLTYTLLKLYF